ncbi:MAG: hypothetical protein ABIQ52_05505 [Vicinamibacterales bacterium]
MRRVSMLGVLVVMIQSVGGAQGVKPLSLPTIKKQTEPRASIQPGNESSDHTIVDECDRFIFVAPRRAGIPEGDAANTAHALVHCIDSSTTNALNARRQPDMADEVLVRMHVNYKSLTKWAGAVTSALTPNDKLPICDAAIRLKKAVDALEDAVHDALKSHGLQSPLTAMLFTGAAFGDTPTAAGAAADGNKAENNKVTPSATIVFESPHFRDDKSGRLHFAFGGRIGFQQILTMVLPTTDGSSAAAAPVGEYKDGLLWNFGGSAYATTTGRSEAYVRLLTGGTRVGDYRTVVTGENGQGFISNPVDNETSQTAPRWEIALGWNYHGRPMEVAHLQKSLLNPLFSAFVNRRQDGRFKKSRDLAGFANPELRWVYGFAVNLTDILRTDGIAAGASKANTIDFGFAVEREIPRGSGLRIPPSTRYVIRGELNLLKAFAGSASENKPQ